MCITESGSNATPLSLERLAVWKLLSNSIRAECEARRITSVETSHNKQLSEMTVGVETEAILRPLTVCENTSQHAPNPPLRQAAGRYVQLPLCAVRVY